jgi:DNA-binding CsgD family transcriptional regulator
MAMLGRESELEALTTFADAVMDRPSGFVVEGEPGIGKTTLWEAAVAAAREGGFRVLSCRPAGSEVQLSFATLGDLLDDVLDETLPELPRPQRRAIEVALLLEDPEGQPPDQRAIGLAVLGALRFLAASRPVLVAVDDVQWLDGPSAAVLQFALRRLRREPLGVLATLRPGATEGVLDLERALPVERLRLGPLNAASIHRIVHSQLGVALPRPLLLRVHEASHGNPFHALELARALDASGEFEPEGSQQLLRTRLAALPPDVQDVLLVVALLADPTVSTVQAVVGDADEGLEAAVASELLERSGDVIRFRHPLLAATVSARADDDDKRRLHRRLADVVHDPEARARHLALAASGPDLEVAAALDDAAHAALARGAPSAAAELLELAIGLTPPGREDDLRRGKLAAAEAHFSSGAISRATAILEELLDELPPGEERADVLVRLARGTHDLEATLDLAERARREAVDDDALLSRVHLLLGSTWPLRGMVSALEDGRLALDHAERSGERRLILDVAARLSLWELWAGRDPTELLARAVALEQADDDLRGYQSPRMPLALQRMYQGRLGEARTIFDALLAEAVALGDEIAALAVRGRLVDVALRAGEWTQAEAHADAAYELAEQIGLEHDGGLTVLWKALVATQLGRVDEARSFAELGARLAAQANQENTRVMHQGVVGLLELSLGNDSAALPALQPLLDWVAEKGMALATHPAAPYALDALAAAGRVEEASRLVDELELEARTIQSPWALAIATRCRGLLSANEEVLESALAYDADERWPFERGRTLLVLGRVQRRARRKAAAKQSLERALEIFEELPASLWAQRARDELGRIGLRRAAPGELTASERRVAELAAAGLTNREVAARLFMSPKTVEANVARAYRKLGIRSRAELGARLADTQDAAQT